jgi:hypothetical protein
MPFGMGVFQTEDKLPRAFRRRRRSFIACHSCGKSFPCFIIPKKGLKTKGSLALRIEVPNKPGAPNVYKDLIVTQIPEEF